MSKSRLAAVLGVGAAAALLIGCAAETDASLPGSCTLSCSQKRVAATEYEVVPLLPEGTEEIQMACEYPFSTNGTSIGPLSGPLQVKYMVYEKVPAFGGTGGQEGDGGEAAGAAGFNDALVERVPRSGIGFEPWIPGGALAADKTNSEHKTGDTVTPSQFTGVVTPTAEWCSDSCGVMTYEIWPLCIEGKQNRITAGLTVGGVIVKNFFNFILDNSDD